jgi:hypothetical protein
MILRWEGETAIADREALANLYHVSTRTVRRYCPPLTIPCEQEHPGIDVHHPDGHPRILGTSGRETAAYDALAAAQHLAAVVPRKVRDTAGARIRAQQPNEHSCRQPVPGHLKRKPWTCSGACRRPWAGPTAARTSAAQPPTRSRKPATREPLPRKPT